MPELHTIAANVARLRHDAGLSQEALANAAGLSRLGLGKIERGEVVPRADTLEELARALKVSIGDLVTPAKTLPKVRFRAGKRVNSREQLLAQVATWLENYSCLEDALEDKVPFPLRALASKLGAREPQKTAAEARRVLGLEDSEAIRDVCGLLEDHGVKVFRTERNTDSFFGLSVAPEDGGPAVVVNTWDRISVERWIFTAAHELGHILLHAASYDGAEATEDTSQEREADRFASYFLMPEKAFNDEWEDTRGLRLLDRVLKVKRIFRVSYKTVLHRLVEAGLADKAVWKTFQIEHKRRFGKTLSKVDEPDRLSEGEFSLDWNRAGEPDGLSTYDFVGDRLSRLVRAAVEKDVISLGRAAEILGISRSEMRELAAEWAA